MKLNKALHYNPALLDLASFVGEVPATINMVASSRDFRPGATPYSTPAWSQAGLSVTTGFTAPDHTATAQKLVENSANSTHILNSGTGPLFGNYCAVQTFAHIQWRLAFIAKAAERTRFVCEFVQIGDNSNPNQSVTVGFDLAGGNVGYDNVVTSGWTILNTSMRLLREGWYLCICDVYSTTVQAPIVRADFYQPNIYLDAGSGTGSRNITYAGNGSSGILLWWVSVLPVGAWNLTDKVLSDDFYDLSTIDINDTRNPGYNWYTHNRWPLTTFPGFGTIDNPPSAPTPASALTISSPSVLQINHPGADPVNSGFTSQIWSAASTGDGSTYVGRVYTPPLLQWARVAVSAAGYGQGEAGVPAWWGLTLQGLTGQSRRFMELDVLEAGTSTAAGGGTLHDNRQPDQYQNGINKSNIGTFDTNFHDHAMLWLTRGANDGAYGVIMFFYDGIYVTESTRQYSTAADPTPGGSGPPQFMEADEQKLVAIFDTAELPIVWPFFIDFARIYQNPSPPVNNPALYFAAAVPTATTTAALSVEVIKPSGTLYWVVTLSSTAPTAAQVKAGQNNSGATATASGSQAVSTFGAQTMSATGLTTNTTYTAHFVQEDPQPTFSNVISSTALTTWDGTHAYWDTANKATAITLSGTALTASKYFITFAWETVRASIGKSSGKWYWELTLSNDVWNNSDAGMIGIVNGSATLQHAFAGQTPSGASGQHSINWNANVNGVTGVFSGAVVFAANDVFGFAFDATAGKVWIHRNGTWINGDPTTANNVWSGMTSGTWYPAVSFNQDNATRKITANFGKSAFAYSVPSGYNSGLF